MRRVHYVAVAAVCFGLVSGCTSEMSDVPGLSASPTETSATPAPSATPESAGPRDLSDPALGVVFTDFPRDQDEQTAAAIQTYMLFETEYWRALTTNVVPPGPWAVATDDARAWIQAQVDPNSAAGWTMTGTLSTAIDVVSVDTTSAVLDVCRDWRGASFTHPDGTTISAVDSGTDPLSTIRFGLVAAPSGWRVSTHEKTAGC